MGLLNRLAALRSNQSGSIIMMTAISMPLLIGSAALATDTIQWALWKRELQRAADTGALAGAFAKGQGKTVSSAASAAIAKDSDPLTIASTTVENAPTAGTYAGNSQAVRVILTTSRRLPFTSLFLSSPPTITAEATAAILSNGNHCVIALETTSAVGITIKGNSTVDLGCGMATNSIAGNAVSAGGSSSVVATPITAVGGLSPSSSYQSPTELQPYSLVQPDPFASLGNPAPTNCQNKYSVNSNQTGSLTSDYTTGVCYRGMDLKGTVTFGPGIYYIDSNSFDVGAQANISGTGVVIVLTSTNATSNPSSVATININGGATMNLTAPTSGTYSGVLIYQDRRVPDSTTTNKINGNSASKLEGALYFPSQEIEFTGTTNMDINCLQMVGRRVTFSGNSTITNNCPVGSSAHSFIGSHVRLVG